MRVVNSYESDVNEHRVTIGDLVYFSFTSEGDALQFEKTISQVLPTVENVGCSFDLGDN